MKTVLVTGSEGFLGRNLLVALNRRNDILVLRVDANASDIEWKRGLDEAEIIFHLAGVNRPQQEEEFTQVNAGVTQRMLDNLSQRGRCPLILLASSSQALCDNPYGRSKRQAEELVAEFCARQSGHAVIYRLKNLFGKWCRPNYNSVVATFCYQAANDMQLTIHEPGKELELIYIDDVVSEMMAVAFERELPQGAVFREVGPVYRTTVGELAELIRSFRDTRKTLLTPDMSDPFTRRLYATYLSYLNGDMVVYQPEIRTDARGALAEFFKSPAFGQVFISRTNPGVVRGNHYHDTKVEKFCVLQGEAIIRFRHVADNGDFEVRVRGEEFRIVDIPPGYAHAIENVSNEEMIVLFWANEIFDPKSTDTHYSEV